MPPTLNTPTIRRAYLDATTLWRGVCCGEWIAICRSPSVWFVEELHGERTLIAYDIDSGELEAIERPCRDCDETGVRNVDYGGADIREESCRCEAGREHAADREPDWGAIAEARADRTRAA